MFENIVLRRAQGGTPISAGQIAEALLYYRKVHIFIDRPTLMGLVDQLGTTRILELLDRPELTAVYCEEQLATETQPVGVTKFYSYAAVSFGGSKHSGELKTPEERTTWVIEQKGVPKKEAKRFANKFLRLAPLRKLSGDHFAKGGLVQSGLRDLLDLEYAKRALRTAVATIPGGYDAGEGLEVELIEGAKGIVVMTNLDLDGINRRRAGIAPPPGGVTTALLLNYLLEAQADLQLAAFYGGDFATADVTSAIIQVRHAELLRRTNINTDARRQFSEVALPDSPSVAEAIDSGERSFDEFLKLLNAADRFKNWLGAVNPDETLLRSYLQDVARRGWIERLPGKILRYVVTNALSGGNPIVGVIAGIVDTFFIEKLLAGWRPTLRSFLRVGVQTTSFPRSLDHSYEGIRTAHNLRQLTWLVTRTSPFLTSAIVPRLLNRRRN